MTLVAAFRCREYGVLLCGDRKEDDGVAVREVEKIFHNTTGFPGFQIFMAGAGPTTVVLDCWRMIQETLAARGESRVFGM
jgi:hypothetical protein